MVSENRHGESIKTENDELYGSIKPLEISKAIEKMHSTEVKPSQIDIGKEIKKIGTFEAVINLHAEKWASDVLSSLTNKNFNLGRYKQKLQTLGKIVEYPEGRGWAEDINEDGSLKVKSTDGEYINLTSPLIRSFHSIIFSSSLNLQ